MGTRRSSPACTWHTHARTRTRTRTGRYVQGCASWSGCCSLLGTCSLNSLPPRLSAQQEIEVPVPCGRPPFAWSAWSQPQAWPEHQAPGTPLSPASWPPCGWAFSQRTLWSSGGREAHRPHETVLTTQREETFLWRDFLCGHWTSEHLSLSWQASGCARSVACWGPRVPPRPTLLVMAWEVHTSTLSSVGFVSW